MSNIVFGECLKLLLSALDISNSRLSKAINVDSSLVNRWIHGKRVPPYNSSYIESISEYITNNVRNTLQEQKINDIYLRVCVDNEGTDNIKDKIRKILLETQGFSIECNKKKRKETGNFSSSKDQVFKVSNNDLLNHMEHQNAHFFNLSRDDKVIFGTENLLGAGLDLLKRATNEVGRNDQVIYMTLNNINGNSTSSNSIIRWKSTLLEIMNNGWSIVLIIKLSNNTRAVTFINCMIPLVQTGKFVPYYIKNYESISSGDELIVVPEHGVITGFSTNPYSEINCGLYLKSKHAINIYQSHIQAFIVKNALPIVNNYQNRTDYSHYLADNEDDIGNRFLYKYCFSVLTLPEHLYWKFLGKRRNFKDSKITSMEFYRKRLRAFLWNIQNYEYKDVYMASSIKDLIKNHQFYLYSYEGIESIHMDIHDIVEYLENIIDLLLKYDNYNMAFLPDDYNETENMENFCCVVKERKAVLFESSDQFADTKEIHLSITEPTLVKTIYDYFIELWEHIPPINKEKSAVITWLKNQVNTLRQII